MELITEHAYTEPILKKCIKESVAKKLLVMHLKSGCPKALIDEEVLPLVNEDNGP